MDKLKCWVKNVIHFFLITAESESWVKILNYLTQQLGSSIFDPNLG